MTFPESDNEPRQRGEDRDQLEAGDFETGQRETDVTDLNPVPNPVASDIPTEWFFDDDEFEDVPVRLTRPHFVTAVLVSHQGAVWLPAVLTTLARSHRTPEVVVAVDTNSTDDSAEILRESLGSDRVISLDSNLGFGAAVSTALDRTARPDFTVDSRPLDTIEWIWLLHDDSAPDTRCLELLLETADDHPSAAILGPENSGLA